MALMMEAVRTSETSVNFNMTTWRYIPGDSRLHSRHRENLKSHESDKLRSLSFQDIINDFPLKNIKIKF
jgi:hypothetical protein